MPRRPRIHFPGALYHVIARGNDRRTIFPEYADYRIFLDRLAQVKQERPFLLHAYCCMPNHVHLLIEAQAHPLSRIMQHLLTGYVAYFNRTYQHKGHLFEGRYRAILCEKQRYLMELVRYIHLNPVRAGLARRMEEWHWTGHRALAGEDSDPFLDTDRTLRWFADSSEAARERYTTLMRDGLGMGHRGDLYPTRSRPHMGLPVPPSVPGTDYPGELPVIDRGMGK